MDTLDVEVKRDGLTVVIRDTPGFISTIGVRNDALEIAMALLKFVIVKVIFVITWESGRVRPDDVRSIDEV
jgi:CO dehydrogenase/acetyl-CoA synthase alpha subunit